MTTFKEMQDGFYNALITGLGFSEDDPFQLIQPSPPLASGVAADQLFWNFYNAIPPFSLTQNTVLSGGNQFLANYQGVMSALKAADGNFRQTIGEECFAAYLRAVERNRVVPGDPLSFRNWALTSAACIDVAVAGASALAQNMLDPVFAAQMNVLPYRPAGTKDVDFTPGFLTMLALLQAAPSRSFHVEASQWNFDVSRTWTKGKNTGFFGFWGGSSSSSKVSEKFASSQVTLEASFSNVLNLLGTPGNWYSSATFGLAFNNKDLPPWDPTRPINWENTFGPNGNMQRFLASLVIVNQMDVKVTSSASFSQDEQTEINANKGSGLWPFYSSSASGGSTTDVGFDDRGRMTVVTTSVPGVAVVVGCTVLPASAYLGAETERSARLTERLFA